MSLFLIREFKYLYKNLKIGIIKNIIQNDLWRIEVQLVMNDKRMLREKRNRFPD